MGCILAPDEGQLVSPAVKTLARLVRLAIALSSEPAVHPLRSARRSLLPASFPHRARPRSQEHREKSPAADVLFSSAMILPPVEPICYTLSFTDGLWELTTPRGKDRAPRRVKAWFTLSHAIEGAKRIVASETDGAKLTLITVVDFKTRTQTMEFPPAARGESV